MQINVNVQFDQNESNTLNSADIASQILELCGGGENDTCVVTIHDVGIMGTPPMYIPPAPIMPADLPPPVPIVPEPPVEETPPT